MCCEKFRLVEVVGDEKISFLVKSIIVVISIESQRVNFVIELRTSFVVETLLGQLRPLVLRSLSQRRRHATSLLLRQGMEVLDDDEVKGALHWQGWALAPLISQHLGAIARHQGLKPAVGRSLCQMNVRVNQKSA